jgi:hypothetical protein
MDSYYCLNKSNEKSHNLTTGIFRCRFRCVFSKLLRLLLSPLHLQSQIFILLLLLLQFFVESLNGRLRLQLLLSLQLLNLLLLLLGGRPKWEKIYLRCSIFFYSSIISLFWLLFFSFEICFWWASSFYSAFTYFSFSSMPACILAKSYWTTSTPAFFSC